MQARGSVDEWQARRGGSVESVLKVCLLNGSISMNTGGSVALAVSFTLLHRVSPTMWMHWTLG